MTSAIRFEFGSDEERDQFLTLNDLRLGRDKGEIVDWEGHTVGRIARGGRNLVIRDGCHQALRPAAWWLSRRR